MDLRVTGANDLARVSKALRAAGEQGKGLRKELYRSIQRSTKEMKAAGKAAAGADLPQRGGLAQVIAGSKFQTRTTGGGRNVGVRIIVKNTAGGGIDMRQLDRGRLRHPVWGNRSVWVTQEVKPQVITGAFQDHADQARLDITRAIEDVGRRIARST